MLDMPQYNIFTILVHKLLIFNRFCYSSFKFTSKFNKKHHIVAPALQFPPLSTSVNLY